MTDKTEWGDVWPFGTITLPIEPAPGMLVEYDLGWRVQKSIVDDNSAWMADLKANTAALLPSRAQLEAAGLSVWDGLKFLCELVGWEYKDDLLVGGGDGVPALKVWDGNGNCIMYEAAGFSFSLSGKWMRDVSCVAEFLQMYVELLAWAGVEDES